MPSGLFFLAKEENMKKKNVWMILALLMTLLGSFPEGEWQNMAEEKQQEIVNQKINDFSLENDCKIAAGQVRRIDGYIYVFGFCLIKKKAKIAPNPDRQPLNEL